MWGLTRNTLMYVIVASVTFMAVAKPAELPSATASVIQTEKQP